MNLVLAVQNAPVLRAVAASPGVLLGELATSIDRDPSNVSKSLQALEREGWVARRPTLRLTESGAALLPRLDALERPEDANGVRTGEPFGVRWDQLKENPLNPRKVFDADALAELAESIVERGVLQPLLVRPMSEDDGTHMIAAGARRSRAIRLLIEDGRWPRSQLIPAMIKEATPAELLLIGIVENGQREDLSPLEEGDAYAAYCEESKLSARALARQIGKGSDSGVRIVQERIKVAREASPAWRLSFEEGACTWEDLRRSVQEARPAAERPAEADPSDDRSERVDPVVAATPPAARPSQPASDDLVTVDQLPGRLGMIFLECADKIARSSPEGGPYQAPVGAYWLDARANSLVAEHRLIAFEQVGAAGWHVRLTPAAWDLIDPLLKDGQIPEPILDHARTQGGEAGWPGDRGYATAWLNTDAKPAPAALPEPAPDIFGEEIDAFLQAPFDQDVFRRLLSQAGVVAQVGLDEASEDDGMFGLIATVEGETVAIVDPDEGLLPRTTRGLARLFAFALNRTAGFVTLPAHEEPQA